MQIVEHSNSKLQNLKRPKFKCDTSLGEHIPTPLKQGSHFTIFNGTAGSGKTSLLMSLLTEKGDKRVYRNCFNNVYLIIPKHSFASIGKGNPFHKHDPEKVYHELDVDTLQDIQDKIADSADEKETSLIIIDDFIDTLKDKPVQKALRNIVNNRRHKYTSLWLVSQMLNGIPLAVRRVADSVIAFKPANNREKEILFQEYLHITDKKQQQQISDHVWQKRFDHMFLDPMSSKLYRNFNEIELKYDTNNIHNGNSQIEKNPESKTRTESVTERKNHSGGNQGKTKEEEEAKEDTPSGKK